MASRLPPRGGIAYRSDRRRRIGGAKDRRASDERGGAVVRERLREVGLDAAVHGDVHASVAEARADFPDLAVSGRDERLATEPGIDRHHEDEVEVVDDVHVELVGAARLDPRDVVAEGGEVRREDRGRDLDHGAVIPRSGDRRKRTAVNPSVPWRWGRQRSVPSGSIGSGNSPGGSTRISGWAARNACTTASFSSG